MSRPIRTTAAVLATLALIGCADVSGPTDPAASARYSGTRLDTTATTNSTTTTPPDGDAERGVHTMGGGG